jgi:L-fuconolactonase
MYEITRRTMLKMAAAATVSNQGGNYRILDPHVHVWKHDPQFPFAAGAKVPDYDATPEMLLDLMKANGVAKTVIIQVIHYLSWCRAQAISAVLSRGVPGRSVGSCRS